MNIVVKNVATVSQILEYVSLKRNVTLYAWYTEALDRQGLYEITSQVHRKWAWSYGYSSHDTAAPLTGCSFWALPSQ